MTTFITLTASRSNLALKHPLIIYNPNDVVLDQRRDYPTKIIPGFKSKFQSLADSIQENPFKTSYFIWLDLDLEETDLEEYLRSPPKRIRIIQRKYEKPERLIEGFIGGRANDLQWLFNYSSLEEAYDANREKFSLGYGDYLDVSSNLLLPRKNPSWILENIMRPARLGGDSTLSRLCGDQLWKVRNTFDLPTLNQFLNEYSLVSDKSKLITSEIFDLTGKPENFGPITLTLVTACFNASEIKLSRETLAWKFPLIVYTNSDLIESVRKVREELAPGTPFEIIPTQGDHLKISCLGDAVIRNPFKTNRFAWIDFTLQVLGPRFMGYVPRFTNKIKLLMKSYPVGDRDNFCLGFYGGPRIEIDWLVKEFQQAVKSFLEPVLDTEIIAHIWSAHPKRFDLSYGDALDQLDNLELPYNNQALVINDIMFKARSKNDFDTSRHCGDQLWKLRGKMPWKTLFRFLDEYLVCSYYSPGENSLKQIGKELYDVMSKVEVDEDYRKRIMSNFEVTRVELPLKYKTMVVTAFFNLQKREPPMSGRRSPEIYLELSKRKTLALNLPMIIYCDPEYVVRIRKMRSELSSAPTEVIGKALEDWEYHKYKKNIVEAFTTGKMVSLREKFPWKVNGIYCLLVWTKMACCADAIKRNPFQAERIVWFDFGLGYLEDENPNFGKHLQAYWDSTIDKIKTTQRWYVNEEIVKSKAFCTEDGFAFTGGFIGGSIENMSWFITQFNRQIQSLMAEGLFLFEEQIIGRIYVEYPERFDMSYGDYKNLVDNLVRPNQNFSQVVDFMMCKARCANDLKESKRVGDWLWPVRDKMTCLEKISFLDEYFVAANGTEDLSEASAELIKAMQACADQNTIDRVRNNLKFVGQCLDPLPYELSLIKDITFVTAFYDLAKRDKNKRKTADDYLNMSRLTLGLSQPMVIYCDPQLVDKIKAIRQKPEITQIIPRILEEWDRETSYRPKIIPFYKPDGSMNTLMAYSPVKFTHNYCLMTWAKFSAIMDVIKNNPFNTNRVAWIDFGLGHLLLEKPNIGTRFSSSLIAIKDKVRLMQRLVPNQDDFLDIRLNPPLTFPFVGGIFGGNNENMKWFCSEVQEKIKQSVSKGVAPLEEQIIPLVYMGSPDRFELSYGNYWEILDNLIHPYENHPWILENSMERAKNLGKLSEGRQCGDQLWEIRDSMSPEIKAQFLELYFLIVYSLSRKDSVKIGRELSEISDGHLLKQPQEVKIRLKTLGLSPKF